MKINFKKWMVLTAILFPICNTMADGSIEIPIQNSTDNTQVEKIPLITSASQLDAGEYGDEDEGQHVEYLIDGNADTFWHSDWHSPDSHADTDHHWLTAKFDQHLSGVFYLSITRRATGDDHPSKMLVQGSNDGSDWTTITELSLSNASSAAQGESETFTITGQGYKNLRFAATDCAGESNGYRKFWHAAEFQLYQIKEKVSKQLSIRWNRIDGTTQETPVWLAMAPTGDVYTTQQDNKPEFYGNWDVETTTETMTSEDVGKNANFTGTYAMFRLRNAATGLYLTTADQPGVANWKEWEYELRSTSDAGVATLFALVPISSFTDVDEYTYPDGNYVLMTKVDVHDFATCLGCFRVNTTVVPDIVAKHYDDSSWDYSNMSINCEESNTEVIEDLASIYTSLKSTVNLNNYPAGTTLGTYKESAVNAFSSALSNEDMIENISSVDGDRTDATAWKYMCQLSSAYSDLLQAKIKPQLNGYYRIVNTAKFWGDGVEKAMTWKKRDDGCPIMWWKTLDNDDLSQIWQIQYLESTGKFLLTNLDSGYRMTTTYNYATWGENIGLSTNYDGQVEIEYVDDEEGEPAFYINSPGQYYSQDNHIGLWYWSPDVLDVSKRDEYYAAIYYDETFLRWHIREVTDMEIEASYTLADGTEYTNSAPIYAQEFHYTRNMKNTSLQALYVPAALPVETFTNQGVSVYYLNDNHAYFDEGGNMTSMTMEAVPLTSGTLIANTPYIIRADETGEKDFVATDVVVYPAENKTIDCSSTSYTFTFTGTYSPIASSVLRANNDYFFSGGSLVQIGTSTASLPAERWYMNIESRGSMYSPKPSEVKVVIAGQKDLWDETGIQSAQEENTKSAAIYDLSGRKVATPTQCGIYIQNGRKVLIK